MKLKITAFLGAIAVIFGAFGAHALTEQLSLDELNSYKTGVQYHLIHALFLLGLSLNASKFNVKWPFYLTVIGILCFSGSIYLLALDRLMGLDLGFLWPVTPLGGLLLILAWISIVSINKSGN